MPKRSDRKGKDKKPRRLPGRLPQEVLTLLEGQGLATKDFILGVTGDMDNDGNYGADPKEPIFDARYQLSRAGMAVVTCLVDKGNRLAQSPIIDETGFLYRKEKDLFLPVFKDRIAQLVQGLKGSDKQQKLKKELEKFVYEKLRRRPTILVNIIDL